MHSTEQPAPPRRWRIGGVVAAMAATLTLAACGGGSDGDSKTSTASAGGGSTTSGGGSGTLTIGVSSDPQTLDPEWGQAHRANETIKNLYAQWTRYEVIDNGDGTLKADLTKDPVGEAIESYTLSDDGKTVNIKLRPDAKLPDGEPITADTFLFKVERALEMNAGSIFDFNILGITKMSQVKKVSDSEIQFKLPNPSPIVGPMLRDQDAGLVDPKLVKEHMTDDDPWGTEWVAQNGAPTGAYVIEKYEPGRQLVLKANPNYWGEKPNFERVVLQVIPDEGQRAQLLRQGAIDIAADMSTDAIARLDGAPGVRVHSVPAISQDQLGLVNDKPPFNDARVRQAIAYAIPYQSLADNVLGGRAATPKGVWPQNSAWFDESVEWPYATDPEKAKQLLAEAGAENLEFTVQISDADADAQALAVPIQSALRDIGVTMNIEKVAAARFSKNLTKRSMQAWIQSGLGAYVDDPYYMAFLSYASTAVINWTNYKNEKVDDITEELSKTVDRDRRQELATELQAALNQDVPIIPLAEPNWMLPTREDIEGVLWEPDGLLTYRLLKRAGD
ncbi:MAG: ABC transporter substrate-binding protein [Solirubrobacteraceae bacterium]|nr:ABC transporter substrate-binding protein [Solirubrobacteraceae bacterium]